MFVPDRARPRAARAAVLASASRSRSASSSCTGDTSTARSQGAGLGTTFVVQLPIAPAARPRNRSPICGGRLAGCRVLVAEDIPDAAEMMRLMIECMGHEVRVAADGVQAVELAEKFQPQIALLDIGMPRMDGYEAARRIRAALGSRVVLVAVTGWGQERTSDAPIRRGSITT